MVMHEDLVREFHEIVKDVAGYMQHHRTMGMETISARDAAEMNTLLETMTGDPVSKTSWSPENAVTLDDIRRELGDCTRCNLSQSRKNIVFGKGNPRAALVLVGEGPGREEDLAGEPFVGEAGQLLTRILQAINLSRDEVYITNVVKCRPPKNRDPQPIEIETCSPFLKNQLQAIRPRVICALGKYAAQTLLETSEPISRLRGKVYERQSLRIVPTFHPASLLRNPQWKRDVWQDMQLIQQLLEERH